jgi:hypothetical protein
VSKGKYPGLGVKGAATKPTGATRYPYVVEMEPCNGGEWEASIRMGRTVYTEFGNDEQQAFAKAHAAMMEDL